MTLYSIDTSALVGAWCELYSPETFPGLWRRLEEMVQTGRLVASEEVLNELERQDDGLLRWAKAQNGLFVPMDADIESAVKEVVRIPKVVSGTSTDNSADPFVIGLGLARRATVVSQEKGGGPSHPKIPYVCKLLGIPHLSTEEFVNRAGWSFD